MSFDTFLAAPLSMWPRTSFLCRGFFHRPRCLKHSTDGALWPICSEMLTIIFWYFRLTSMLRIFLLSKTYFDSFVGLFFCAQRVLLDWVRWRLTLKLSWSIILTSFSHYLIPVSNCWNIRYCFWKGSNWPPPWVLNMSWKIIGLLLSRN